MLDRYILQCIDYLQLHVHMFVCNINDISHEILLEIYVLWRRKIYLPCKSVCESVFPGDSMIVFARLGNYYFLFLKLRFFKR